MSGSSKLDDLSDFITKTALPRVEQIKFDKRDSRQFLAVAFLATMTELAFATLHLVKVNLGYHGYLLLRQALEIWIDLILLAKEEKYHHEIEWRSLRSRKKIFAQSRDGNPYLASIAKAPDFDEQVDQIESQIREYPSLLARKKPRLISERFNDAEQSILYSGLYSSLCSFTHVDTHGMVIRHVDFGTTDHEIRGFSHGGDENFLHLHGTFYEILETALTLVEQFIANERSQ